MELDPNGCLVFEEFEEPFDPRAYRSEIDIIELSYRGQLYKFPGSRRFYRVSDGKLIRINYQTIEHFMALIGSRL